MELLHDFTKLNRGPMFKFWVSFLVMMELLLIFICASREGNWYLHLCCCKLVLIARSCGLDLYGVYLYELVPVLWAIATP